MPAEQPSGQDGEQTVTLSDRMTARVQQATKGEKLIEGQVIELGDGTTAYVHQVTVQKAADRDSPLKSQHVASLSEMEEEEEEDEGGMPRQVSLVSQDGIEQFSSPGGEQFSFVPVGRGKRAT